MTDAAGLVEWLREQLDDLEYAAQAAQGVRLKLLADSDVQEEATDRLAAFGSPTATLARVEAERRLIDLCEHANDTTELASAVLRLLAWSYRHRPGWQESWRP